MKKIVEIFLIGIFIVGFSLCFYACSDALDDYKTEAKEQITLYVENLNYNIEHFDSVNKALDDCIWLINLADSKEEVDIRVEETKNKIESIINNEMPNDKTIPFKNQSYSAKVIEEKARNIVIRSYSEMKEFFYDYRFVQDEKLILNQYKRGFFNDNALVFCLYRTSDARIIRQITNVYVENEQLQVEITGTIPASIIGEDGLFDMRWDAHFNFNVLTVRKSDVDNITEVTIIEKLVEENK